jgi:hypothetical protein
MTRTSRRVSAVRNEKLVAGAEDSSGAQMNGNVRRWNRYQAMANED